MAPQQLTSVEDLADHQSLQVERVRRALLERLSRPTPLADVTEEAIRDLGVSEPTVREAIIGLLYSGVLQLTEDRRLAPREIA